MHFYVQSKNCTLIIPERNNLNEASRLAILRPVRRIIENRSRSRLGKLYTVTDNVNDKARGLETESAGGAWRDVPPSARDGPGPRRQTAEGSVRTSVR